MTGPETGEDLFLIAEHFQILEDLSNTEVPLAEILR